MFNLSELSTENIILVVLVIIIAGMVYQQSSPDIKLILVAIISGAIVLFIANDYMELRKRKCRIEPWGRADKKEEPIMESPDKETVEGLAVKKKEASTGIDNEADQKKIEDMMTHSKEMAMSVDVFDRTHSLRDLHEEMAGSTDNQVFNRMKYMGVQPELSKNIRSAYNKYSLQPFLEEELQEHENRRWWSSDHLYKDM